MAPIGFSESDPLRSAKIKEVYPCPNAVKMAPVLM
jgi:hypothetical protein